MAISQEYLQPYQGGQNRYMPQGTQGTPGGYGAQNSPGSYKNQFQSYTQPNFKPYKQPSWWESLLFGSPEHEEQTPRFTPQGQDVLSQLLSGGIDQVNNPYQGYEPIERETMDKFWQEILPQIQQSYAGQGGRTSSPEFTAQLAGSAKGLAGILAAQKARYGMENRQQGLARTQLGLTDPFDTHTRKRTPGVPETLYKTGSENADKYAKLAALFI